jgi:hypothetical protein
VTVIFRPEYSPIVDLLPSRVCWLGLGLLLGAAEVGALGLHSRFDALDGPGWRAETVELILRDDALELSIGRLQPVSLPDIAQLHLACPGLQRSAQVWHCPELMVQAAELDGQALEAKGRFDYRPAAGQLDLTLDELRWGTARLELTAEMEGSEWRLTLNIDRIDPRSLRRWLGLEQGSGRLGGTLSLSGTGAALERSDFDLVGRDLDLSASGGNYAAAKLDLDLAGRWQGDGRFDTTLRLRGGELYLAPLYWQQAASAPVPSLALTGRWQGGLLQLDRLRLDHPAVLRAGASLTLRPGAAQPLERARVEAFEALLPDAYRTYLQPWLSDTALADLDTAGRLSGRFSLGRAGIESLELRLDDVMLQDRQDRFALHGLGGDVVFDTDRQPRGSRLRWRSGHMYRIALGAAGLDFESRGGELRLTQPARLPLLDGELQIRQLLLSDPGGSPQLRFGARLQAVSMEALSAALDWPPLAGTLAGVIPEVRYRDRRVEIDGALLVKVFGGDVTVANLQLEDPFGNAPRLRADVELFKLDLLTLTRTFDIGRMEGKLSGHVRDLQLVSWQPVRFDAYLHTPEGDDSRRRISQRAVETISDLGGGGATGAVSRGVLSLFEDFRYRRLAIGCRLDGGICRMSGVGPAPDGEGYYLVEGSGLPRIDVIGYNRQVDWHDLLIRLQAAANSEGPVIQ